MVPCNITFRPRLHGSGRIFERTCATRLHGTVQILLHIAVLFAGHKRARIRVRVWTKGGSVQVQKFARTRVNGVLLERIRFTFMPNGRREFVQSFPLIFRLLFIASTQK